MIKWIDDIESDGLRGALYGGVTAGGSMTVLGIAYLVAGPIGVLVAGITLCCALLGAFVNSL